jgi:excisionase family DNA binding protein
MPDTATLTAALEDLIRAQVAAAVPAAQPSDTVLLSINDVSSRLSMARSTIYDLIRSKTLKTVRVGHRVFVRESELERFITAHEDVR